MRFIYIFTLLLVSVTAQAETVVLDFEEFAGNVALFEPLPASFDTKGYTITSPNGAWFDDDPFAGSQVGLLFNNTGEMTLSKVGGTSFSLIGFDYSFNTDSFAPYDINFTALTAGGETINSTVGLPGDWYEHTYLAGGVFNDIVSITISGVGTSPQFAINNVVVSAVPVPAAVWLFGSALAGLGWMRRRKTA